MIQLEYERVEALTSGHATDSHIGMHCSSDSHDPVRQTCDAFLEIGPHSEFSSSPSVTPLHFDFDVPAQITHVVFFVSQPDRPPRNRDTPVYPSIQSTVLRI
jgi:hypothetical protein